MRRITIPSCILVSVASACYTLALPPFDLWPLAFLVSAPLYLLIFEQRAHPSTMRTVAWAIAFGEITTVAVGGPWLFRGANAFFGQSAAASALLTLLITFTHAGVFIGLGVACCLLLRPLPRVARVFGMGCTWTALEHLRSTVLYGCPWNLLGHAFHSVPVFAQAAGIGGVPLLSWAAVTTGAALGSALLARFAHDGRAERQAWLIACAVPLVIAIYGLTRIATASQATELASVRVGLVQANVGRDALWDRERAPRYLEQLIELSRTESLRGADLIVWGENAVPFFLNDNPEASDRIHALADDTGAAIMLGAPRSASESQGRARFYNSLYLFAPGTPKWQAYDKTKLLPYIEAVPAWARGWIRPFNNIEYTAGIAEVVLRTNELKIGPSICFEATYPELIRRSVDLGADILVNVSNDSWYGTTSAQAQHFAMSKFRTIETGLPLVRVANTGVSAVIDGFGRVIDRVPINRAITRAVDVPLYGAAVPFYASFGDWFAYTAALVWLVLLTWAYRSR